MTVFTVMAHSDPALVARLVDRLAPHPVVLHVDRKSDAAAFARLPRTTYVRERVDVRWLGYSTVEAQASLLSQATEIGRPGEYVVMLSGACYPVRPIAELEKWLHRVPDRQHCEAALVFEGSGNEEVRRRLERRWLYDRLPARGRPLRRYANGVTRRGLALVLPRRRAEEFLPLRPVAGSAHFAITVACAEALLHRYREDPVVPRFRHAISPDEMVFHSLLHSSSWSTSTAEGGPVPRNGRLTSSFAALHYLDPHLQGYRTLEDLPAITASGRFFTRKVSTALSSDLLDVLDRRL